MCKKGASKSASKCASKCASFITKIYPCCSKNFLAVSISEPILNFRTLLENRDFGSF